jgi:tyrosinase
MPIDEVWTFTWALNQLKWDGTYDAFVQRHMEAMMDETPAGDPTTNRNSAHSGPVFLPWHRASLLEIEDALNFIDPSLGGIPYWDWAADQALPNGPWSSPLWTDDYIGPDGDPNRNDRVLSGPFADWYALIYDVPADQLVVRSYRGLRRQLGRAGTISLPTNSQVNGLDSYSRYDAFPWNESSELSTFRNHLEGWHGGNLLHNRVHRWVGGDMLVGTSPNDPVFFLHHCNVDRLWWNWQQRYGIHSYRPISGGPAGHNLNDTMLHLISRWTPASVLNILSLGYTYA